MVFGIRSSHVIVLAIIAGVAGWMYNGKVVVGGQADASTNAESPASRNAKASEKPFKVRIAKFSAVDRSANLEIRGRTQADLRVSVRAETAGKITGLGAEEGDRVNVGDLLCVLERGAREARLLHAEAQLSQAQLDFDASDKLSKKGYSSRIKARTAKAALDAAKAVVAEAKLEIARTEIRAPISGVIHEPNADVGDMLSIGAVCATILNADPMLMTGQVSERDIGSITVGMTADILLVTGEKVQGKIRYIATAADEQTRTFRIDIEIDNDDYKLRDGVTASAIIELPATRAHLLSPSTLVLNDNGKVGVRSVGPDKTVAFNPVQIIGADKEGIWVAGLPETLDIITVGQDFVIAGQPVEPVIATAEAK